MKWGWCFKTCTNLFSLHRAHKTCRSCPLLIHTTGNINDSYTTMRSVGHYDQGVTNSSENSFLVTEPLYLGSGMVFTVALVKTSEDDT